MLKVKSILSLLFWVKLCFHMDFRNLTACSSEDRTGTENQSFVQCRLYGCQISTHPPHLGSGCWCLPPTPQVLDHTPELRAA